MVQTNNRRRILCIRIKEAGLSKETNALYLTHGSDSFCSYIYSSRYAVNIYFITCVAGTPFPCELKNRISGSSDDDSGLAACQDVCIHLYVRIKYKYTWVIYRCVVLL